MLIIGFLFLLAGAFYIWMARQGATSEARSDDAGDYLLSLDVDDDDPDEFQQLLSEPFISRVLRPIAEQFRDTISTALPGNYRDQVHLDLVHAGLSGRYRAEEIITSQALGAAAMFVAAVLVVAAGLVNAGLGVIVLILFPLLGAQIPRTWLSRQVEERREVILRDLPDTLDLLAISVEAGVGFEGALDVVADQFDSPLADEFSRTLREMELGLPRREALQNLKKRTDVPALSNFVLALTQADSLGMPIGRVLKVQAGEMRIKRQQWAREKAAKLPVKILFPLVAFIFPPVFIVVLGPAAAEIGGAF